MRLLACFMQEKSVAILVPKSRHIKNTMEDGMLLILDVIMCLTMVAT